MIKRDYLREERWEGITDDDAERAHACRHCEYEFRQVRGKITSESECELKERHRRTATRAKTIVHDLNIRVAPAQLRIDNNEPDCPIRHRAQNHKE